METNKVFGMEWEIFGSSVGIAVSAIFTAVLLWHWNDWNSALALLIGAGFGWALGVFLSPFKQEKDVFATYGKAATAFATGFLVSKLDRVFEMIITAKTPNGQQLAASNILWRPFLFATLSLCMTALYVFTSRQYGQRAAAEAEALKERSVENTAVEVKAAKERLARAAADVRTAQDRLDQAVKAETHGAEDTPLLKPLSS